MYPAVKRAMDILISLILLLLVWWILLLCALAIKLEEPSAPVTYNRNRAGRNHKLFLMYKFRTMKQQESGKWQAPTENTLSRAGSIIRKLSLDELLQLLNVLKGEMSLIGPRPLPPHYLGWFTTREDIRHSVRPGITGLAQINGRAGLDWDRRFAYDVTYVINLSFSNDLRVLFSTVKKVFKRENVMVEENSAQSVVNFDRHRAEQVALGTVLKEDLLLYHDAEVRKIMQEGITV